jgi:uncharacterized small protein (DUF1192 family)
MDFEDLEPRARPRTLRDLAGWSVDDLETYIVSLEGEIARARAAIVAKRSQKAAADLLFGKS